MITFVYCYVCLLIVCYHATKVESKDFRYSNSYYLVNGPNVEYYKRRVGLDVLMKCNKHRHDDSITWEFKHCNYTGVQCDDNKMNTLENRDEWKKLDFNKNKKRLFIKNITEENIGIYRCLNRDYIVKIFIVDVTVPASFLGPIPQVVSLISSPNSTVMANTPVVIRCNVSSLGLEPPEIRWFKECNAGNKCDVQENGQCYCVVPTVNSVVSINTTMHVSKFSIHNSRNSDSGTYICLAISVYGRHYKSITITVQDLQKCDAVNKSFSLLMLIVQTLGFVLVYNIMAVF